jgi:hypothetical protein
MELRIELNSGTETRRGDRVFDKSALKAETVYFEKSAFYMSKMRAHVAADARVTSGALYR